MDTVYLAFGVFQWKTPIELCAVKNYAPYIVAISKYELHVLYWNEHKRVSTYKGESSALAREPGVKGDLTKYVVAILCKFFLSV